MAETHFMGKMIAGSGHQETETLERDLSSSEPTRLKQKCFWFQEEYLHIFQILNREKFRGVRLGALKTAAIPFKINERCHF